MGLEMPGKDTAYGPLLFVNEDPSEGGTAPHRRAIYQHVQLKYAKWKRVGKSQRKRSSRETRTGQDFNETEDSSSQFSFLVRAVQSYIRCAQF